jgi:hypothetical protein
MIDLYVNTDTGDNAYDGTSATFTGGTTGPKRSLAGAVALLGTLTDAVTIHCKGATADTAAVRTDLKTTTAANTLTIQVDAADRHAGAWDETKYHLVVANNSALNAGANYVTLVGLQVKATDTTSILQRVVSVTGVEAGGSEIVIDGCLVTGDFTANTATSSCVGIYVSDSDATVTIRNTKVFGIVNNTSYGQGIQISSGTVAMENVTVTGCANRGVYVMGGTVTATNVYAGGNGTDFSGGLTFTTCACEDNIGAAGLTPEIAYDTTVAAGHAGFGSLDPTNPAFLKPVVGSVLIDAGTDVVATNDHDITGDTFATRNDIGAHEYDAGTATAPTVTTQAVSGIGATGGTLNGTITDTGGENCDQRGFVIDLGTQADPGNVAPAASGYALAVWSSGSFGVGAFTVNQGGLASSTTHYVRAFAHNSAGYSYGAEVTFDTLAASGGAPRMLMMGVG